MLGRLSLLYTYLNCWSYEIPLRYKTWGAWGATSQKFASKLDQAAQQQPAPVTTYHIRGLWYAYFRVMFLKCRAASSFIRDLGTRTFIILDVIWTCQFLPQ